MDFTAMFEDALDRVPDEHFDRSRFVPAVGDPEAEVMLVGEAPGADEVERGEPFVGRAGKVLDEVLASIDVSRDEIYITNLVKVRPPDNRDPTRDEIDAWKPVLDAELDRVDPEMILSLGNFASRELLDTRKGITQLHGKVFTRDGRKIMPIYHPAATLYDRSKRPDLETDLRAAFGKTAEDQSALGDYTG